MSANPLLAPKRFGETLFLIVLMAALAWLVLHLLNPEQAYALQYPLTALTAGLPAVATASYGIRIILDFPGVAERAERIASGLKGLLACWEAGPEDGAALQQLARGASDVMLGDVAAWRRRRAPPDHPGLSRNRPPCATD